MNRLDYCIKMQIRMIAGELITAVFLLFMTVMFLNYGGYGGSAYGFMWSIGTPCLVAVVLLAFSALRKLFVRSVYGGDAGLYQSLPISASELVTSKIFAAGVFLLLAFLPVFLIFGSGLGSLYIGKYRIRAAVTQILVNLGYTHSQVPLFAALALIAAVLGCFAAAAAVQLVITLYHSSASSRRSLAVGSLAMAVFMAGVLVLNVCPYLLLAEIKPLFHPAAVPAAEILLNTVVVMGAGYGNVQRLERGTMR